jgi:hypothetical protein
MPRTILWIATLALFACACARAESTGERSGGGLDAEDLGRHDFGAGHDFAAPDDLAHFVRGDLSHLPGADLATAASPDLAASGPTDLAMSSGGGLDPGLALPDPSGAPCTTPGSLGECPGVQVCRFFTPSQGRCESCVACGNLGATCVADADCDILFMCYQGRCTNFCQLGTSECGAVTDCLNIGHPTYGVCRP